MMKRCASGIKREIKLEYFGIDQFNIPLNEPIFKQIKQDELQHVLDQLGFGEKVKENPIKLEFIEIIQF